MDFRLRRPHQDVLAGTQGAITRLTSEASARPRPAYFLTSSVSSDTWS